MDKYRKITMEEIKMYKKYMETNESIEDYIVRKTKDCFFDSWNYIRDVFTWEKITKVCSAVFTVPNMFFVFCIASFAIVLKTVGFVGTMGIMVFSTVFNIAPLYYLLKKEMKK